MNDIHFMRQALAQAKCAWKNGEVPVGAVIVQAGEVVATGFNQPICTHDPTAHAEIVALRSAAHILGNYRLPACELFVTLEPCLMCMGAIFHARLARIIFGAADYKTGVAGSVLNVCAHKSLNYHTALTPHVLETECAQLLKAFFIERRQTARSCN